MRLSIGLLLAAAALAIVALASLLYQQRVQRDFSTKTTITMGTVLEKGALLKSAR